jgi:hypothetical protein
MSILLIIAVLAAIACIVKFVINPAIARKDARETQEAVDKNIECQLLEGHDYVGQITVAVLAKHSDKNRMARIMASRISDYLEMGAHPDCLARLFKNLGLHDGPKKAEDKEIELSALIKHYVNNSIEVFDLKKYQGTISADKAQGLSKINNSFLVKAGDSMLVWSPLNN